LNLSRRQMPAFTKIVPFFGLQNHNSAPSILKSKYLLPMLHVHNTTTSLPHIHTSKDPTKLIVLLISQKDYEHYTSGGSDCKLFLFLKYMSSDMVVSAGQVKALMNNMSQRDLSAGSLGVPRGMLLM
jgi:hypothetical protein